MQSQQPIILSLRFPQLLEAIKQLSQADKQKLITYLLKKQPSDEHLTLTHLASERSLAKDWLTQTEDEAWQDL
jgi:hypothetical protein